ncbi:MAG: winged helix-turn-helix transcriptional regulator [bacterium]|nr:winged helix-turn-helix transcriptional regulator [bacterium]
MAKTESTILEFLKTNPDLTIEEIAEKTGLYEDDVRIALGELCPRRVKSIPRCHTKEDSMRIEYRLSGIKVAV